MATEIPRRLLEYLAEGLVEDPDAVAVEQFEEDDGTIVLELCLAEGDYGKVIGRGGRTAQALRTVVRAAAVEWGVVFFGPGESRPTGGRSTESRCLPSFRDPLASRHGARSWAIFSSTNSKTE